MIRPLTIRLCIFIAAILGASFAWVLDLARPQSEHSVPTLLKVIAGDGVNGPEGMVWIPGGEFLMGSDDRLARLNERPAHRVRVRGFWMDRTHVTNAQFESFIQATGYVTTAERKPDWEALKVLLPPGTPQPADGVLVPGALVFVGTDHPVSLDDYTEWWRYVPGASWRHPQGPGSSIRGKADHPVVQVSYEDAQAYAHWIGKRLPTEAEWEFAARGGLSQATYTWGNNFSPQGQKMANIWEGSSEPFPVVRTNSDLAVGTSRVCTFARNGYGLCDMTGNAWQWISDWYRADAFAKAAKHGDLLVNPQGPENSYDPDDPGLPANAPKRVIRGGSFLCSASYCRSYRVSARRGSDPDSSMSHIGFRLVITNQQ